MELEGMMDEKSVFAELFAVNVNEHTETKKSDGTELTYLSWPFAWAEVKKRYPGAKYEIVKQENGLPYVYDENTGYMVSTRVTINGVSHEMWLPVMDGANKAIMRCLVKNLAMFGLGLYIYAGEDLPESEQPPAPEPVKADSSVVEFQVLMDMCKTAMSAYAQRSGKDGMAVKTAVREFIGKNYKDFTADDWRAAAQAVESWQ